MELEDQSLAHGSGDVGAGPAREGGEPHPLAPQRGARGGQRREEVGHADGYDGFRADGFDGGDGVGWIDGGEVGLGTSWADVEEGVEGAEGVDGVEGAAAGEVRRLVAENRALREAVATMRRELTGALQARPTHTPLYNDTHRRPPGEINTSTLPTHPVTPNKGHACVSVISTHPTIPPSESHQTNTVQTILSSGGPAPWRPKRW